MSGVYRTLLIEDSPGDARLIREMLTAPAAKAFTIETAARLADGLRVLERNDIDAVLLDLGLPDSQGLATLERLRAASPTTPVVVMTGNDDVELGLRAVQIGAQDYLVKGLADGSLVARAIRYAVERKRAETALWESEARLRRLNRLYRTTSEVNQLVIRERDSRAVLRGACQILVEAGGFLLAWIGIPDRATRALWPIAVGGASRFLDGLQISLDDTPDGHGPHRQALDECRPIVAQDWTSDEAVASWRARGLAIGVRSSAAVPIVQGSRVFGLLNVYAAAPQAFDDEVLARLTGLADDLGFALLGIEEGERREDAERARRQAEEALRASERKYKHFFEQGLAGHYVATPEGRVMACNSAFARILGFESAEDAMGADLSECHADPRIRDSFLRCMEADNRVERLLVSLCRRDGTSVPVIESAVGVRDPRGRLLEIHGFVVDDTERTRAEAEFRQAQKMEAVGRLAGGVAHDFNNILSVILGFTELLKRRFEEGDPLRGKLGQIQAAAERGVSLTRQLLAFSRKQMLQPCVLDLNQVVVDMEPMLRRLIGEDVQLTLDLCDDPALVMADPGQLEQVIMNLAINSRDAMPRGGTLAIATAHVEKADASDSDPQAGPGPFVELSVRDTGCGMDADTVAHVFEPFFTTKEGGTGLGLPTVYGVVKQTGGELNLTSAPGAGTTVTICIPRVSEAAAGQPPTPQRAASSMGTETILLLEDDAAIRAMAREALELAGYRVLSAARPDQGREIALAHTGPIDLFVSDVIMPGMSGPAFGAELAALRPGIRTLYISGYTAESLARRGVVAAGTRLLQKPITPEDLLREVRGALDGVADLADPAVEER